MENDNNFYETDLEDIQEIEFNSVRFIDAMRMAKNTWDDNHDFDIDPRVMEDAVPMAPVKIISRSLRTTKKGERPLYLIWAAVKVTSVDYYIPVRFFAYVDEFEEAVFIWTVAEPRNKISIEAYVSNSENVEDKMWSDLLD